MEKIKILAEKTSTGFSAFAETYSVFTTGATKSELVYNLVAAVNLYFEEAKQPIRISKDDLDIYYLK